MLEQVRFTIPEILSLIGLAQSLYVLVYMGFRAGSIRSAAFPFAYFLCLGGAFFLDFAARFIGGFAPYYGQWQWALWGMTLPLSVLLIIQVAQITKLPSWPHLWVLGLMPLAWVAARLLALIDGEACPALSSCPVLHDWLVITGLIAGTLSLLTIWINRGMLETLHAEKTGKDRYWLIIMLVVMNIFLLTAMLVSLTPALSMEDAHMIRTFLGLSFVYLAGTSLFRIYPQALQVTGRSGPGISTEEQAIAARIETLLNLDKVYHEPGFSRADLARELGVPENSVSRVINVHFGKSFPQLLNERRVEDAKRLLSETEAGIKIIASEVGFNSMASFNRVFRDLTGTTPSEYRGRKGQAL